MSWSSPLKGGRGRGRGREQASTLPFPSCRLSVVAVGVWQVEFRATIYDDSGFVAIDDVMVNPGACPSPVTCDFEANSCLWENMKAVKWTNG